MKTVFLLMAQYDGRALIPLADVCRDFFSHLTPEKLMRKVGAGEIALPVVRMDAGSQKTVKCVHLTDLADYIDARRRDAVANLSSVNKKL